MFEVLSHRRTYCSPRLLCLLCLLATAGVIASPAAAQVPAALNYQGRLLQNTADQDAVAGTVDIDFSIWSEAVGGTELWTESWTGIALSNGIFSVLLGTNGSPLDPADFQGDSSLYLQLVVGGETLSPRQQLGSAPFAIVDLPANELQDLSLSGDDLSLSGSAGVIDLSAYRDNTDEQDLSLSGDNLSLSGSAGVIDLSAYRDNTDAQALSLNGNNLSLSGAPGVIDLSAYRDNTDAQTLAISGNDLTISGSGSTVDITAATDVAALLGRVLELEDIVWRTVFVTSARIQGQSFGSAAGADQQCQAIADAAGLNGEFMAWISDSLSSPSTRFSRRPGPFVRVDRVRVAEDWGDLTDGSLLAPIDRDELGRTVPFPTFVWTATLPDGTPKLPNCNDWTGPAGNSGAFGTFNFSDGRWTENGAGTCNGSNRLYCFEQ